MKQSVSPVAAAIVVVVVIGLAVLAFLKLGGSPAGSQDGQKPPGMPPAVAAEFQRKAAGMTGPRPGGGSQGSPALPMGGGMPVPPSPHP